MPPRGVKKGTKRARQYEHVKESAKDRGASEGRAEEIAARTVNKEKARSGESRTRSKSSTKGPSPSRRGGQRSGDSPTRDELYAQAKQLGIEGRSKMNKQQLARAGGRKAKWGASVVRWRPAPAACGLRGARRRRIEPRRAVRS